MRSDAFSINNLWRRFFQTVARILENRIRIMLMYCRYWQPVINEKYYHVPFTLFFISGPQIPEMQIYLAVTAGKNKNILTRQIWPQKPLFERR